ncbi:MAG TPA: FG-GAP-like repeat-containing protein [Candidatus Thermoplasmatota archaeon]|nr:FG-GAP-like repeat-containing protein [Candidatus Thermoplasmatota archaeon]
MRRLLPALLLAACLAPAAAGHAIDATGRPPPFEDATAATGLGALDAPPGGFVAACWTDADGDGWPDLVLRDAAGRHARLRNVGGARFEPAQAAGEEACADAPARAVLADLDDDGRQEALTLQATGAEAGEALRLGGRRARAAAHVESWSLGLGPRALAAADYDRDGALDVLVLLDAPPLRLLRNYGTVGRHVDLVAPPGVGVRVGDAWTDAGRFGPSAHPVGRMGTLHHLGLGNATRAEVDLQVGDAPARRVALPRVDAAYRVEPDGTLTMLRAEPAWPAVDAPAWAVVGEPAAFAARPGEPGAALAWEFGDGTWAWGERATHAYDAAGERVVRVHTTVPDGATGVEAFVLRVLAEPPGPARESPLLRALSVVLVLAAVAWARRR